MRKIIQSLRQQPEHVRQQIVYIITFACAIILILLWVLSLGKTISSKDTATAIKSDLAPFTVLKDNLVGGYQSVSNSKQNQ